MPARPVTVLFQAIRMVLEKTCSGGSQQIERLLRVLLERGISAFGNGRLLM